MGLLMSILSVLVACAVAQTPISDREMVAAEEYVRQERSARAAAVANAQAAFNEAKRQKVGKLKLMQLEGAIESAKNLRTARNISAQWHDGEVGQLMTSKHFVTSITKDKRGGTVSGVANTPPFKRITIRIENIDTTGWKVGKEIDLNQAFVVVETEAKVVDGEVVPGPLILVVEPINMRAVELARKNAGEQP